MMKIASLEKCEAFCATLGTNCDAIEFTPDGKDGQPDNKCHIYQGEGLTGDEIDGGTCYIKDNTARNSDDGDSVEKGGASGSGGKSGTKKVCKQIPKAKGGAEGAYFEIYDGFCQKDDDGV